MRRALIRSRVGAAALAVGLITGCAFTRLITEATYPDYYEVRCSKPGCKAAPSVFCTHETGDAGLANVLECVRGDDFIDTLFGSHEHQLEARYSVTPACACTGAGRTVTCDCPPDGGL